jgi:hypothetical protein
MRVSPESIMSQYFCIARTGLQGKCCGFLIIVRDRQLESWNKTNTVVAKVRNGIITVSGLTR